MPTTPPPSAAKHAGADRYEIDGAQSSIRLRVYRDGPLARFGHNHVIVAEQIRGTLYREKAPRDSEFELSFPVAAMAVDRPVDRAVAGGDFATPLPPEAVAGTRANMLGPELLAQRQYPDIQLRSVAIDGEWPTLHIVAAVTVRGFESRIALPVALSEREGALIAEGETRISQAQLGLAPYSVLGGGLRVGDGIDATYRLVMHR